MHGHRFALCCALAGALLSTATAAPPPPTQRGDVVDTLHGVEVPDPYRWLEDADAPETAAWVRAQNAVTQPYLAALPQRSHFHARLTELWNHERYTLPEKGRSGHVLYERNDGLQDQAVLWIRDNDDAAPRPLLDPNQLSADSPVALTQWALSPDGKQLVYSLASAGSDWNRIRVRRVADAEDLDLEIGRVKFSGLAWDGSGTGFFYSRYPDAPGEAGTFDELANQRLMYHRIGSDPADDVVIHATADEPRQGHSASVTDDGRWLVIYTWEGTSNNQLRVIDLGDGEAPNLKGALTVIVDHFEADYSVIGSRGTQLYVLTNDGAPRNRILAIDTQRPQRGHWREVVAEGPAVIDSARLIGGQLIIHHLVDARSTLTRYALDGRRLGRIDLPGLGTVGGLSGRHDDPELYFSYTDFTRPSSNYRHHLTRNRSELYQQPEVDFAAEDYVTEQVFATSRDGTRVPIFITYRKGLERDGKRPTLLYGYGGFNISLTPRFSVAMAAWLESGGVYAVANLRGGGEYGREWHRAGTLENKQNGFDDFIAAAGWLTGNGWTSPAHLAIHGRSNGGLLVGAVVNQYPGLFAAAVPGVGVMDMLRFHKFTIGWAWVSDYGSPDDPEMFPHLLAYSPLHNLRPETRYPATLVITADHDDRVVPGHSFKYAAAMQHAQAGEAPILIRVETQAGHGAGTPTRVRINEWADILGFVAAHTGVPTAADGTPQDAP
jgi:prolyl oligopeptidase